MARARSAKSRPTHSDFSSIFACVSASAEIGARIRTISAADELLSAIPRPSTTGALAGTWRSEVGIEAPVSRWFDLAETARSEEHTSELQSLMRISYAVFCLKKKNKQYNN